MKIDKIDDFSKFIMSIFVVKSIDTPEYTLGYEAVDGNALIITLSNIDKISSGGFQNPLRDQSFSLQFLAGCELPQGTYRLVHEVLGDLEMFLVPRGPVERGFLLTATFN